MAKQLRKLPPPKSYLVSEAAVLPTVIEDSKTDDDSRFDELETDIIRPLPSIAMTTPSSPVIIPEPPGTHVIKLEHSPPPSSPSQLRSQVITAALRPASRGTPVSSPVMTRPPSASQISPVMTRPPSASQRSPVPPNVPRTSSERPASHRKLSSLPIPSVPVAVRKTEPIPLMPNSQPRIVPASVRSYPPPPNLFGSQPLPVSNPSRPDYQNMTESQQEYWRRDFMSRFETLRRNNPAINIQDPPPEFALDQLHDYYDKYLKQIKIAMDSEQWKTYLVIFFLSIEVFGVKILGLNFSGYTLSQLKIINRYEELLIELGEQNYVHGGSNWPVEARILIMCLFNAVIFIVVKYMSKWLGGDSMAGTIQTFIDSLISGGTVTPPSAPQVAQADGPQVAGPPAAPASDGPDFMSMIGNMFGGGGGGGGGANILANLGTMFTQHLQGNNRPAQGPSVPPASGRRRQPMWDD